MIRLNGKNIKYSILLRNSGKQTRTLQNAQRPFNFRI